jgi:tetratricopeptide (TPR) repeat protein/anti-sigma regulatory factor (Ser/Thr protein kinase)
MTPKITVLKIIFILAICYVKTSSAEVLFVDTTYNSINKITIDSLRKEKLIAYVENQIVNKTANASILITETENEALKKNDLVFLGQMYSRFGFSYISTGDYSNAFPIYLKAVKIYDQVDDPLRKIRVYQDMMWIQLQLKDYDAAKKYLNIALTLAINRNIKSKEAEIYNFFGILYDSQKQYKEAISSYRKALVLNKNYGNKYNEISTLTNLGISLRRSKQYSESLIELEKVNLLSKEINNPYYKQASVQNLAELTFEMKNFDLAEKYILEALAYQKSNEFVLKRGLFENLSKIYKQKRDFEKALKYADSLIVLNSKVFDQNKVAELRNLQAKYDLSLKEKQNEQQQITNLKQSNDIERYKNMIELAAKQQKLDELNLSFQKKQTLITSRYQTSIIQRNKLLAKKDSALASRKLYTESLKLKSIKNGQMVLLGIICVFFIFMVIQYHSYQKNKKLNQIIIEQKNELEEINADKDKIFSIIGHDLRSPFNTLRSFTHLIDDEYVSKENINEYSKELKKVLSRTTILLDNLLYWSNSQMQGYKAQIENLAVDKLIDTEINNLASEATAKNIKVVNNVSADLMIPSDANMLGVIFRNFLSNAIKFSNCNGLIEFNVKLLENQLLVKISDHGVGMSQDLIRQFNAQKIEFASESNFGTNSEKGTGLGLFLIKNFVKLLNADVNVNSPKDNQGTTFNLLLPLKS